MRRIFFGAALILVQIFTNKLSAQHVEGRILVWMKSANDAEKFLKSESKSFSEIKKLQKNHEFYILMFDGKKYNENILLEKIKNNEHVAMAQFDHIVELREKIPNDTFFDFQWSLKNTGSTGGTTGDDVKTTFVWDSSTGGITANGDTVVVAIIDGGFDRTHEDLYENLYIYNSEIPNDGIDNDSNGYIDDYIGYNVITQNDSVVVDPHGTHVAGIIAARSNNKKGIAGINRYAKWLPISCDDLGVESEVVAAYLYVLDNRRLYNSTKGKKGIFIVSTNSSFGVTFGLVKDFPIWCAMYDSMGIEGIFCAAATENTQNFDVDTKGDIPSNCTSKFLTVVASTEMNDQLISAYGNKSVDLAAPGENIYSTDVNNQYSISSGTSFATPHVAGGIALLISAAHKNKLNLYMNYPDSGVLYLKDLIMKNVDANSSLKNYTVSGGRLNLYKAYQEISLGIKAEKTIYSKINIFPNPADEYFYISSEVPIQISISDLQGKILQTDNNLSSHKKIDTKNFANGIYFLNIDNNYFQKIVVIH